MEEHVDLRRDEEQEQSTIECSLHHHNVHRSVVGAQHDPQAQRPVDGK
jgi:hypothetical protein